MIRFILNEREIATDQPPGTVLLDLIRYRQHLMGTKIGCREGDCGACTVLVGELKEGELHYQSMTSCLLPIGNIQGKHVVTIEGINMEGLNPVQQAMADEGATQCGFCTPGFVMSLAGFCLSHKESSPKNAIAAIDGNICRCTGYKSIERAATKIADLMQKRKDEEPARFVSTNKILPSYFSTIKAKLQTIGNGQIKATGLTTHDSPLTVGGGTDLYVQKHDEMHDASIRFVFNNPALKNIRKEGNKCIIGASATVSDLAASEVMNEAFPNFQKYVKLVSSAPIRNMATVAGNFINASPIGDLTILFLALNAEINLSPDPSPERGARPLLLKHLYKGYKQLNKQPEEIITSISFELPGRNDLFNFEKVSKRTYLDIASVNSAIKLTVNNNIIEKASVSAGGVGPIPLFLQKTSDYLKGKTINEEIIPGTIEIAQTEISPISDARGTKEYKRLLLGQLIRAHFVELFPNLTSLAQRR